MPYKRIPYKQQTYYENSLIRMPDGTDPRFVIKILTDFVNIPVI